MIKNLLIIHPLYVFSVSFLPLTKVCSLHLHYSPPFSACSSPLVYLLSSNKTRPIGTQILYTPLRSPEPPVSPLNKSLQWMGGGGEGWLSLLHLSTNKPCCLTWQHCRCASHPSFPASPENRENNKVSLDPELKSTQLVPHRECPQAEGVGCERVLENYRGKFCHFLFSFNIKGPRAVEKE